MSSEKKKYPEHIGFILDGNRRWAKSKGLPSIEGHRRGAEVVKKLEDWLISLKIKEATLYTFSIQNFSRTKREVDFIMKLLEMKLKDILKNGTKARIRFVGRIEMLPERLIDLIHKVEKKTEHLTGCVVNFAVAYGGQEEIIDAIKEACRSGEDMANITVDKLKKYLYVKNYPDLIIRTSGEVRTSNFLAWQQAYSEWFFVDKYWPDFNKDDLKYLIDQYLNGRDRRYGK